MSGSATEWDPQLYDGKHAYVWTSAADLVDLLAPRPGERILDLGCGTGHLTAKISATGARVTGVDASGPMIAKARNNYPKLHFEVGDALSLPYREEFDAVFSNATLHWIRPPEKVAASIWNALRPGGRLVAEFGGRGNLQSIVDAVTGALTEAGLHDNARRNTLYFPTIAEYTTLLEGQGLAVTYAVLFDRPTPLEDGENGMRHWLAMFGRSFLAGLPDDTRLAIGRRVEGRLRPRHFIKGAWVADYRRIRVVAHKVARP